MNDHVDVLVVGAGPAGLTLACDLRRRGVSHRVVSAAAGGFEGSRAKGVQPRTLEVLDDLGVLPYLEPRSTPYPKLGVHLGPVRLPKTMVKTQAVSEDLPHPNMLLAAQYATDAALRARLEEAGGRVDFATRLTGFEQDAGGVVAILEGPGGTETVRARFLVGADGGGSTVRQTAGITFDGTTDETDRMIVADVTLTGLSRDFWHMWPRGGGRFLALCPLPGGEKFQLSVKLRPEEQADLGLDALNRLVTQFMGKSGTRFTLREVHWASVWRPNIRLASSYRRGNVFLVGDAAHVHPPAGAQGMNTGIQDSYNLGWKLGQVLAGAPDALLDTYEAERRPVAARVLGLSTELYASMKKQRLGGLARGDEERQLTLTYAGGPLAPGNETDTDTVGAGDRAPDATYVDPDGRTRRLHEAFRGPHFSLLAVGGTAIEALGAVRWPDGGAELKVIAVPEPADGLARGYGISGPAHILIRPDGYIASTAHRDWAVTLEKSAAGMLPALAG